MRAADLSPGTEYAYRKGRKLGEVFIRVLLVQYVDAKRHAQIEHAEGPLEGLKEWVRPTALQCEWKDVEVLKKLESKALALEESYEAEPIASAVAEAANEVFGATGEDLYVEANGVTDADRDVIERVAHRAGLPDDEIRRLFDTPAYRSGSGRWHLPSGRLIPVAERFAAAEPGLVNMYLDDEVTKYKEAGYQAGERYMHKILVEKGPAFALARQWAGATRIADDLRADNERLRRLLAEAVTVLRARGYERDAAKYERALRGT
ncbi:MAG: hypothetical protein ACJ74O_00160 [Frankiaceae bacterium]